MITSEAKSHLRSAFQRLLSSKLARNVLAVAGGAAMGQAVIFAFSPLITRIYSPEAFGLQGVFLSLISIFSPVIALRYPMAIVLAQDEVEVQDLSRLSLTIAFLASTAFGLLLLVFRQPVAAFLGADRMGAMIYLLPIALFCVALQDVADYKAARIGTFRLVAVVTVVQSLLTNSARVIGGLLAPVAVTLMVITSAAPAIQTILLVWGNRGQLKSKAAVNYARIGEVAKLHRDFPVYRAPTDMLNAASQTVPVILLAALFSPTAAGFYVLARSVLNLPSNIIGSAIGNVFYARFANLTRTNSPVTPILKQTTIALLLLSPAIIAISYFSPIVFSLLFGQSWHEAGKYAQWMSIWIGISIANTPAIRLAAVIGRQNFLLFANIIALAVKSFSVLLISWNDGSPLEAVALFSIASAGSNVVIIAFIFMFSIRFDRNNTLLAHGVRDEY